MLYKTQRVILPRLEGGWGGEIIYIKHSAGYIGGGGDSTYRYRMYVYMYIQYIYRITLLESLAPLFLRC